MQHIRNIKWLIIIVLAGIYACNDNSFCLSNQQAIQAGFYTVSSGTEQDTTLSGIHIWGLQKADSLIYDSLDVVEMYLPGNLNSDSCTFIIKQETLFNDQVQEQYDTLKFRYRRELYYVSGECGMSFNLTLDTVLYSTNILDSVRISYANVNYGESFENVKIYIEH